MQTGTRRKLIVLLLALSCLLSLYLLWNTTPEVPRRLTHTSQVDSLITITLQDLNIPRSQVRKQDLTVDSIFTRSVYHIRVAPNFSKTTLHYSLKQELWPYRVETIAKVEFPERQMQMHLLYNDQIYRTLVIDEDEDLTLQSKQPEILPGQNSHEVD